MHLHQKEGDDIQHFEDHKSLESISVDASEHSLGTIESIILSDLEKSLVKVVIYFNHSVIQASER